MKSTVKSGDAKRRRGLLDSPLGAHYGSFPSSKAVTLTFRGLLEPREALEILKSFLLNYLSPKRYKYTFYMERTDCGNPHFHGIIHGMAGKFCNSKFARKWRQLNGFYYESKLNSLVVWNLYCKKDQGLNFKHPLKARVTHLTIRDRLMKIHNLRTKFEDFF